MEGGGVRGGERRLRQLHHSKISYAVFLIRIRIDLAVLDPKSRSVFEMQIRNPDPAAWTLTKI
jgi:hypothetical protein